MFFCIGDIHGHFKKLLALMGHCRAFAEAAGVEKPSFILLGDYIDRGPASREVLEFLATRPANLQAICGNHEDMMMAALAGGSDLDRWLSNGGSETLASYGVDDLRLLPRNHFDLVSSLPAFIDDGLRLFVHAGIDPAAPEARDRQTLLWTRKHPPEEQDLPRFIVHGHTPVRGGPELKRNRLNLDTGAGWGWRLSAAAFRRDSARPIVFLDDLGAALPAPPLGPV